jgi:ribosome biogenesis GTPase A
MLAASHAIGTNEVMEEDVAAFLGDILIARYPKLLTARYGFVLDGLNGPALVEAVAKRRGCLVKGGGLDLEKAALILLDDYRSGTLGRISLESPETRSAMIAAAAEGSEQ